MYFLLKTKIPMVINEPTIFRRIHFKTVILIMTALFRKVLSLSVARDSADTPYFLLKRLYSTYLSYPYEHIEQAKILALGKWRLWPKVYSALYGTALILTQRCPRERWVKKPQLSLIMKLKYVSSRKISWIYALKDQKVKMSWNSVKRTQRSNIFRHILFWNESGICI